LRDQIGGANPAANGRLPPRDKLGRPAEDCLGDTGGPRRRANCYDLLAWRTFKELSRHIDAIADGDARSDGSRSAPTPPGDTWICSRSSARVCSGNAWICSGNAWICSGGARVCAYRLLLSIPLRNQRVIKSDIPFHGARRLVGIGGTDRRQLPR
jgi:hypothetical protein